MSVEEHFPDALDNDEDEEWGLPMAAITKLKAYD
ncbi:MAG: hypothetical protein DDT27_00461 [Dehalococcoidia bacterium]|nr:hypothetical protein [Chloroflexota bacterium]